jgi:hypothetical protein
MKRQCCYLNNHKPNPIRCSEAAEWEIAYSDDMGRTTDACRRHVGELLSDAPRHSIVHVRPDGTTDAEHAKLN